jgi:hypothetical protein
VKGLRFWQGETPELELLFNIIAAGHGVTVRYRLIHQGFVRMALLKHLLLSV